MKAFLDTSALIKKYVLEPGSDKLERYLEKISEIVVAPLYGIELNSALERRLNEGTLSHLQIATIRQEAARDLNYFSRVIWNESLERKAIEMIKKYCLKTLDSVQLASGMLADAELFLTSDQDLYKIAFKETTAKLI